MVYIVCGILSVASDPDHRERKVAGSNPGSGWVATGGSWVSFHPGFIPWFLTCWSTDPTNLTQQFLRKEINEHFSCR